MQQILFLEMNEIIFPYLEKYISKGHFPTFARLFRDHGYIETVSEEQFSEIEPWIQWVTVHTGKTLKEHGIFRLGDIVGRAYPQIWEHLEQRGFRVGAISPMNAENRLKSPCFFMPDPWTDTTGSGSFLFLQTYKAIKQAVNDNAQKRVTPKTVLYLVLGWIWYSRIGSYPTYARAIWHALHGQGWPKAVFLDRFLADIFLKLCIKKRPQYASLFLNAAAHVQHHYLYSSSVYEGDQRNPEWYMPRGRDPLFEAYRVYDEIIGDALRMSDQPRIMIATALQQEPHGKATFFYRLKNHEKFFRRLGMSFRRINTLMSRDFVVECESVEEARNAEQLLLNAADMNGVRLFAVDNRGLSLFVELIYSQEIKPGTSVRIGSSAIEDFYQDVAFVAIRNGQHNGIGYFLDTGIRVPADAKRFPVREIWDRVQAAVVA